MSSSPPSEKVTLKTDFILDGKRESGGTFKMFVNGTQVAEGEVQRSAVRHGLEPFEVGRDSITPVTQAYKGRGPFAFTGTIESVRFDIKSGERVSI